MPLPQPWLAHWRGRCWTESTVEGAVYSAWGGQSRIREGPHWAWSVKCESVRTRRSVTVLRAEETTRTVADAAEQRRHVGDPQPPSRRALLAPARPLLSEHSCSQGRTPGAWPRGMTGIWKGTKPLPGDTSQRDQKAVFFLVGFRPQIHRNPTRVSCIQTIFFSFSFDFQRGRHRGMEKQNEVLLFLFQRHRITKSSQQKNFSEQFLFS